MSNLSVRSAQPLTLQTQVQKAAEKPSLKDIAKSPEMAQDNVAIKKGLLPTLKGGALGALTGGTLAGLGSYAVAAGTGADYAILALPMGGALGGIAGGVTGAVVANVTNDKAFAAMWGGVVGGATGAAIGLLGGDIKSALSFGAIGLGAGLGGAYAGALVAQEK